MSVSTAPHLSLVSPRGGNDPSPPAIRFEGLSAQFGQRRILKNVSLDIPATGVTCIVGPSGAGKSTLLRALNRMNEEQEGYVQTGNVLLDSVDVSTVKDLTVLRRTVGLAFQKPCVFPRSILQNTCFGLKEKQSEPARRVLAEAVLRRVGLWEEVKDRLSDSANTLSLGQQQRLCIARTLIIEPKVLLLDEPTASIDPVSSRVIEGVAQAFGLDAPVIMVTHNIAQAKRVANQVVFMCDGAVIETGASDYMFSAQSLKKTRDYLGDEFCLC